jgi:DNA polymerase-3 subunit delta
MLGEAKVAIDSAAMPPLLSSLSGNRMINHNELQKLLLYIEPNKKITEADVESCLSDQSNVDLDDVVYAAFSGAGDILQNGLHKLRGEGVLAITIIRAAARHAMRLHWCKSMIAAGADGEETIKMLRPPVFFKKLPAFRTHMRRWPSDGLIKLLARLLDAETQCKTTGFPAEEITAQILLGICYQAAQAAKRAAA